MSDAHPVRVLVVEDEEAIAEGLVFNLQRRRYEVDLARNGREALDFVAINRYDLILLDIRMPEIDGYEVCRRLRRDRDFTPILMLTARDQQEDVVYGLQLGADDYVVKPFDLAELIARIDGLLRRQAWQKKEGPEIEESPSEEQFSFGEFWVDFSSWQAKTRLGVVELSRKELAVMKIFAGRPNQVITRRELLTDVWELPNHPNTRVVDNVIVSLRKAFEENSWRPRHIHSVRGVGYRFVP